MYCANSSFPVPLSPVMNTDASVGRYFERLVDGVTHPRGHAENGGSLLDEQSLTLRGLHDLLCLHQRKRCSADEDQELRRRERLREIVPGAGLDGP